MAWLVIGSLLVLGLLADLLGPADVSVPAYLLAILFLIVALPSARLKIPVAAIGTVFTAIHYFSYSAAADISAWQVVLNHVSIVILIWLVIAVCLRDKRSENALSESEGRLRAIMEASSVILWTMNAQGQAVEDSWSWRVFTGQSFEELKGLGWLNAYHPDDRKRIQIDWQRALAGKTRLEAQYRLRRHDGQWRWTQVCATPLLDSNGSARAWVGMNTDITERKQAEADALFILDLSECASLATDPDELMWAAAVAAGEHLQAARCGFLDIDLENDRFTVHRDYHPRAPSVVGAYPLSVFGPAIVSLGESGRVSIVCDTTEDERTAQFIDAYQQLGVRSFVAIPLLREGRMVSTLLVAAQEARSWSEGEVALAKAVAERTWLAVEKLRLDAALRQSEEALREADKRKDEFLATLAHELRNPLALMRNVVNLIQIPGSSEGELRWGRDILDRQVNYLTRLTDDLFDVSRITRQKLELQKERVDLREIVNAAVESSRPAIDEREHELVVTLPKQAIYVEADRVRFAQVLMNLLTNAAKYTPKPGEISLSVEPAGGLVVVRVKDTGVGLSAESLAHVFDMFYQVDRSYSRSDGGLGLGLTLVRQLVEMHGGTIEARSAGINQGSEFIVRLPILREAYPPQPFASPREAAKPPAATARRILVADDFPESANALARLLRADGNEVQVAQDGLEALDTMAKFHPHVVVLDIAMPKLNGYDAARIIREQPWGKKIILIAMTGWGHQQDLRRAKEVGFDAHLTKPVKYEALLQALDQLTMDKGAEIGRSPEL
ncbi:MAG: response regulator [Deltaproteobacteria bacterium]|nr:response regulator [Deltaproteobacteria bacterium]